MPRSIIRTVLVLACVSTTAQAQLGGLIRKATQKVVENKVEEKTDNMVPVKPMSGDPLTESSLAGVLKGLSFEMETNQKTRQLSAAGEAKAKEVIEAERAAGNEPEAWRAANSDVLRCVSRSIDESEKKHQEEAPGKFMALAADPNKRELATKAEAAGKKMAAAQQKGDMPAYTRAANDYMKLFGFDVVKDSAVAFAKCGKPPEKPASLVKLERLRAEQDKINEERRAAEEEVGALSAKAAGMPADKYALARERLWAWSVSRKAKKRPPVTKEEEDLFAAHAGDIGKVESVLR
jgi:hypothetical protein